MALCVTRVAISLAKSFAVAASMLKRAPVSCFQAALRMSRRAASSSVAISASHKLNCLELRNWVTESEPLFGIVQSRFECALRDASGLRGNSDSAAVESGERHFVAFAFVADTIRGGHFAIGEDEFATCGRVDAKFFFFFADFESRRSFFDDERGDAFSPFAGSVFT